MTDAARTLLLMLVLAGGQAGGGSFPTGPNPNLCPASGCAGGCTSNTQCASLVCDIGATESGGPGQCVATADVIYVDNQGCAAGSKTGTRADPVCQVNDAFPLLSSQRTAIRVMASATAYAVAGSSSTTSLPARIYGPATPYEETDPSQKARLLGVNLGGSNFDVTLDGLWIAPGSGTSGTGISCNGQGTLSLRRVQVTGSPGLALDVQGCMLNLDRSRISDNNGGGLNLTGVMYSITNTLFADNQNGAAVNIDNNSSGLFRFNALLNNNNPQGAGGIYCELPGTATIADSIVLGNSRPQTFGFVTLTNVVVETNDPMPGPVFVSASSGNYHLTADKTANACCIDQADNSPTIQTDLDGNHRPYGPRSDIGAYEVHY